MEDASTCSLALKLCPECNTEKPVDAFHSKGERREHICKVCSNTRKKKRRDQKKRAEKRKRAKNHTLILGEIEVVGNLSDETIEKFGRAYGNLIQEVLNESK